MPIQDLNKDMMRKQISVTPAKEVDGKRELVDGAEEKFIRKPRFMCYQGIVTFAVNGESDISSSSAKTGRSAERWRRLALFRSGDVEPNPGPPRARSRGGELLTADITAGPATRYRRALDDFDMFLAVRDCGPCSSLHAQGPQFVVEAAAKYLGWGFESGELSSGAAGTLVAALRRLVLQFHLARQSLILLFISVRCGGCINPGSLQCHPSSKHLCFCRPRHYLRRN